MKKALLSIMILAFYFSANAQTKNSKITKSAKPEIDKLYEKYKDLENITLYTPHGELYANVFININDNDKPISITIHGVSNNKPAISEFISNTIKMKTKQGYKVTKAPHGWGFGTYAEDIEQGLGWVYKEEHSFQLVMKKGKMYFRVDAGCCEEPEKGPRKDGYTWEIETGDSSRQGGNKASNFDF